MRIAVQECSFSMVNGRYHKVQIEITYLAIGTQYWLLNNKGFPVTVEHTLSNDIHVTRSIPSTIMLSYTLFS